MPAFLSILFTFSFLFLFFGIYLIKKDADKINGVLWIIPSLLICLAFMATVCGIVNLFKIPINRLTCSIICIVAGIGFWYFILAKNNLQKFYFKIEDVVSFAIILLIAAFYSVKQFGVELTPIYETSDPSMHLQMAMDILNTGNLGAMFFSSLINSLMIATFSVVIPMTYSYKVFILSDIAFFAISGLILYSASASKVKGKVKKAMVLVLCFFYMIGYPLNNMVFGFCYLGIAVSLIATVLMLLSEYGKPGFNNLFLTLSLMVCMLAVSMSYMLFAPAVYIATFIVIAKPFLKNRELFTRKHIFRQLSIFLVPCILSVYYFAVNNEGFSMSGVENEGYIYRDLISNFFFLIFPVIAYIVHDLKSKKLSPVSVFFAVFAMYAAITFFLMIRGNISTYYFYKVYYAIWLVSFLMAIDYTNSFERKQLYIPICYVATVSVLFGISETKLESKLSGKNPLYCDRSATQDLFDIYRFNTSKIFSEDKSNRREEWAQRMDLYNYVVKNCNPNDNVYIADNWLQVYWYEAVTNQRFSSYAWTDKDVFKNFYKKCKYVVIIPESEDYKNDIEIYGDVSDKVYENTIGYVARVK